MHGVPRLPKVSRQRMTEPGDADVFDQQFQDLGRRIGRDPETTPDQTGHGFQPVQVEIRGMASRPNPHVAHGVGILDLHTVVGLPLAIRLSSPSARQRGRARTFLVNG